MGDGNGRFTVKELRSDKADETFSVDINLQWGWAMENTDEGFTNCKDVSR